MSNNIFKKIAELKEHNIPFVLTTVVDLKGSVPGKVGFKMIVESDGTTTGTVGGGALEQQVRTEALQRLAGGESGLKEYLLTEDADKSQENVEVIAMSCSGRVQIYYEVHGALPTVYVFGGGHVGRALLYHLAPLGYHRVLIDNRPDFATKEVNPHASEWVHMEYADYARKMTPAPVSFVVILTQGHNFDYHILKALYERNLDLPYIGVISSRAKAAGLIRNLKKDFGEDVDLSPLHTPIGLDIGGSTAEEIALSITAEIQAVRYGKNNGRIGSLRK